jgi:polysaccharide chain length determinant protein (PEP-CTERM system associated)
MHELLHTVLSEIRSGWRFRWYGAAVAWLSALLGWLWVTWQPDIYEASARVYVDTSSVLRPLLNDRIVPSDITTRLLYVRQALLGRDYLERVAADNGLVSAAASATDRDAVLLDLSTSIMIDAAPASRDTRENSSSIFSISFRHQSPATATGVVESVMNFLIEDTHGADREGTDIAGRFLDERILEYENRLEKAEQALADFQKENSERLPGSEGSYFERIQREREGIAERRRELSLAESRRDGLQKQLTSEAPVLTSDTAATREPPPNSLDARIRDYRAQLDRLLLDYTERHPDVIAVRDALARLEEQRTEQLRSLGITDPDSQLSGLGSNPVYQAVRIALNEVDVEIATLLADLRDREQRLSELQALIGEVPEVEAELARLNRDYAIIRDQYQLLIQSRETQLLSRKASDSDAPEFRILNPPSAGPTPVAPRRLFLLAVVLAAALGAGAGLCYVLAQLKPVFSSGAQLRAALGLPVLGTVSRVTASRATQMRNRLVLASFACAMVSLVVVFGAIVVLEVAGPGLRSLFGVA